MRRSRSAFTMIELLMVIMLVAILGATALPSYLDFRNEGRAASVRYNLAALRSGIKNQIQQAILKCDKSYASLFTSPLSSSFAAALQNNDITFMSVICTTDQIPNSDDRKFINFSGEGAAYMFYGPPTYSALPANAFINIDLSNLPNEVYDLRGYVGTPCNAVAASAGTSQSHWLFNESTLSISPGTDTAGINECSF